MDENVAQVLIDRLSHHQGMMPIDMKKFMSALVTTDVPDSSRFYEELPNDRELCDRSEEDRRYNYFSLRRILRNRTAQNYKLSASKRAFEASLAALGAYSSDSLSRSIRADTQLVELMTNCLYPFSLLGKLESFDYGNRDERLFRVTRPILIIPGLQNDTPVYNWENANAQYHKASLLGFVRTRRKAYLDA